MTGTYNCRQSILCRGPSSVKSGERELGSRAGLQRADTRCWREVKVDALGVVGCRGYSYYKSGTAVHLCRADVSVLLWKQSRREHPMRSGSGVPYPMQWPLAKPFAESARRRRQHQHYKHQQPDHRTLSPTAFASISRSEKHDTRIPQTHFRPRSFAEPVSW